MRPNSTKICVASHRHLIIPDVQARADVDLSHLEWLGNYIVDKRPDVLVCIGDFADMPSLSSYDRGKKCFEGRRYKLDVEAAKHAMDLLLDPMRKYNAKRSYGARYKPRMVLTLGNHEDRITRAIEDDSRLEGTIGLEDLGYEKAGWEVYPFLQPVNVDGIIMAHYFTSGVMGRPVTTASALLTKRHMSAVMGHVQQRQIAYAIRADGKQLTAIFAGACYLHDEDYLGKQGNNYWRGVWMLHEVKKDGTDFDEMPVSLRYLQRKYSK